MRTHLKVVRILGAVICASLVPAYANAASILLNGSFEDGGFVDTGAIDQTMSLTVGATTIANWTVVGDTLAWITTPNPWGLEAENGNLFLDLTNFEPGAPFGGVSQTIPTVVGADYVLSFSLGSFTSRWGGPPVSILATAGGTSQTCSNPSSTAQSTWTFCTVPFTAAGTSTAITLVGSAGVNYIGLDNVSVELANGTEPPPPVPEPASVVLLGGGVAALVTRLRRRRQAAL